MSKNLKTSALICLCLLANASAGILISRGKPVYTSSGASGASLVDGKFLTAAETPGAAGNGFGFPISNGSWIAIKVGAGPTKAFVNWNNPVDAWSDILAPGGSCGKTRPIFTDYTISTSANSTNGSDGTWNVAATITGNYVTARGHIIDFTGASWVKLNFTKANSYGFGTLAEIEVFDISKGADIWFFAGTSITQRAFKEYAIVPNFGDQMATAFPTRNVAVIPAGIGCIRSSNLAGSYLRQYLAMARNATVWAIEMGTNDGMMSGTTNLASFTKNMQEMIDSCKAEGIVPIIAHALATDSARAKWQLSPAYVTAIDNLVASNKLPKGPDFYGWFKAHPTELISDGTHPNTTGAASMQKLWAMTATAYFQTTGIASQSVRYTPHDLSVVSGKGRIELQASAPGTALLYSMDGRLVDKVDFASANSVMKTGLKGLVLVRFISAKGVETYSALGY